VAYNRGNYQDKWRIERTATKARIDVGLDQITVLDPNLLVDRLGASVFHLSDLISKDDAALKRARRIGFDGAAGRHPESGEPLILLNCGRPRRRRIATLMEELAHLLLEHEPTKIAMDPNLGFKRRTFNAAQENEAYDLGAALLLPKERIQRDVKVLNLHRNEIADEHNCSPELVDYRIRRMQLWKRYTAYAQAA
jgi:Zn-dependent peptidase ImmA (M78 family)